MDFHKNDLKFYNKDGDLSLIKKYNDRIIEKTIAKHEANIAKKRQAYSELIRERTDVIASYLKSRFAHEGNPIEKYLSKREMAHLRGQKILQTIKRLASGKEVIELSEI